MVAKISLSSNIANSEQVYAPCHDIFRHTKICTVCGFDNNETQDLDLPTVGESLTEKYEDVAPENYPGF